MSESTFEKNGVKNGSDKFCFVIMLLIIVTHFAFLAKYFEPSISAIDSHGYYGQAKEIATSGVPYKVPVSDIEFLGYTWNKGKNGRYFSLWPSGFPALVAIVYKTLGPVAGMYLNPVLASLTLLGLFLLCRSWIGSSWGVLAAILYAVNPVANKYALIGYSHTSSTFFLVWGIYLFSRWMETRSAKWALASGLALGIIPFIRTPEIVTTGFVALFALVIFRLKEDEDPNGLGPFLLSVAVPILLFFTINYFMFGSFLSSGYSLVGIKFSSSFKISGFLKNSIPFLKILLADSGGFPFVLGFMGIVYLLANNVLRRFGILILLITLPITIVNVSYVVAPSTMSMSRLLIPTIPFYVMSAVWFLKLITENNRSAAIALSSVLIAMTAAWGLSLSTKEMKSLQKQNAVLTKITNELKKIVEPGSILIADEIVCQNLDYFDYWKLVDISSLTVKKADVFGKKGGHEFFSMFEKDLRKLSKGKKVYWLSRKTQSNNYLRYSKEKQTLNTVATIKIPRLSEYQDDSSGRRGGAPQPRNKTTENVNVKGPNIRMERMLGNLANGQPLELYEWVLK